MSRPTGKREISRDVADEFGSLEYLSLFYDRVSGRDVLDTLLVPIVEYIRRDLKSSSSASSWISALHKVVPSALDDVSTVKALYNEWSGAIDDEARHVGLLQSGMEVE
jgi:hypothetical protein